MADTYGILYRNNINYSHDTAESISYYDSTEWITATDVQGAIDELKGRLYEIGEEYTVVDKTTASSGIAPNTIINLNSTASAIFKTNRFLTVLCFTDQAAYHSARTVWAIMDRHSGHYFFAIGHNSTALRKGNIRFGRHETDTNYTKVHFEMFGFPSGTTLYLQKLIFIPE